MLKPRQLLYTRGGAGDPLPVVFQSLADAGTRFLKGQLCLICAAPGVGKSAFILSYAVKAKVPTLYLSADSDGFTQLSRMVSILTGQTTEAAMAMVREERLNGAGALVDELPIRFRCDSPILFSTIEDSLEAFAQEFGDYPSLVIVDNITNVRAEQNAEDPFEGLESLTDELHRIARETGACIVGLHHVTGPNNTGSAPVSLAGIKEQIGRVPEVVITLHRVSSEFGSDVLNVSTVKNRSGKADPSGRSFVGLAFDGATMSIKDLA